jgi:hypothetical protein
MTRLSCHRFRSNEVRLCLSLIAYNLGNLWRRLVLPKRIDNWSLTSLQQRLVKTGGRLVKHARYYWLLLAESVAAATRGGCSGPWCGGSRRYPRQRDRRAANLSRFHRRGRQRKEKVSDDRVRKTAASGFGILRRGKTDPFRNPWKHPALKTRLDIPFRGGRVYVTGWPESENGNSG